MNPRSQFNRAPILPLLITLAFPLAAAAQPGNELRLQFMTGGDDLRGGNDNFLVSVLLQSGPPLRFDNVNGRQRWPDHSSRTITLPLPDTVRFEDIKGVRLETTFGGGLGGDNWNLDRLTVSARIGGTTRQLFDQGGTPLFRFTGDRRVREFPFSAAPITPQPAANNELILQFMTGGDDLRGGNDNVHVSVLLQSGTLPPFNNVNGGKRWPDHSSRTVTLALPATVRFENIEGVRLETTSRGGVEGDNWNLDRLTVSARIGGMPRQLFDQGGTPLFRFTGDQHVRVFRFGAGAGKLDFNLEWSGADLNGLPLNPRWTWQRDNPGVPSAEICHYFTNNGLPDFADCTNQTDSTKVDTPVDWDSIWCEGGTTKGFKGHLNWFTVTFTGTVGFGDETFWDGDYYIPLGTDLNKDGKADGLACISGNDSRDVLHTEFDSRETINHFQTPWWKSFHDADKATKENMMNEQQGGREAIATGLFSVDFEHGGGKSELHPVYAMAVNVSPDPADNVWAIFVRNTGNEGYCSHRQWPAEFTTYTFRLPWREGMREVEPLYGPNQSQFRGTDGTSGPAIAWTPDQGVDVTFTLPDPSQTPLIEGELHLRWSGQPPVGRRPPNLVGRVPGFGPEPERAEKRDEAGTVREAFERLPPAKRRQVAEAGQPGPIQTPKLHPLRPGGTRQLRGLPAPPSQVVRLGKRGDVLTWKRASSRAKLRALCGAWNGSPPGFPADLCKRIGH